MDVYIWGYGECGQLGLGDTRNRYEPTLLLDPKTGHKLQLIHIECGGYHTVGLTKNGQVVSWGDNDHGQLGHGDIKARSVPTKIEALDGMDITKISCGRWHTVVLTDQGEVLTWGVGDEGLLGYDDSYGSQFTPKKVEALAGIVIVDVACGEDHTCAVTSTGSILTWGKGIQTGHGEDIIVVLPRLLEDLSSKGGVVSVSANRYHTACVTKNGEVCTFGNGDYGMLGHGDERNHQTPKHVEALVGKKSKIVSCGCEDTAVCTEDGEVYTFGQGMYGQLGHGDRENQTSPALVQALAGKCITQLQCGWHHTMALTSSGFLFSWGSSEYGALGHGNVKLKCFSYPCLVEGLREHNVVQISGGSAHCAALVDPTSPSDIRSSQQASFNNKERSNVVFKVDNQSLLYSDTKVLTQKSDYFAAMFRHKMRESIERVVNVSDFSKAAFLHLLEYIHLDDFTVSMDDIVELLVLSDMYQMEGLKYSCMGALEWEGLSEENTSQILLEVEDLKISVR